MIKTMGLPLTLPLSTRSFPWATWFMLEGWLLLILGGIWTLYCVAFTDIIWGLHLLLALDGFVTFTSFLTILTKK